MPAVKVRVPKVDGPFYGEGPLSVTVKAKLALALDTLEQRAAPVVPPSSLPSDSVTIWISDAQQGAIDALSRTHRIEGSGPVASGLLHAWALEGRPEVDERESFPTGAATTLDRINHAMGDRTRPDQAQFFNALAGEVLGTRPKHQVVFAEASTGVGKTRAFLALAADWCSAHPEEGEHAIIAAPSYNVLLQLVDQWDRMAQVYDLPASQIIVGQQEFVSQHALERALQDHPDTEGAEAARAWLKSNGKPAADDPFGHPWLLRSLRVATRQAWTLDSEVVLDGDVADDDAGMVAYRAQFSDAKSTPIVFCTHAMLAVDVRLRAAKASKEYHEKTNESASEATWAAWQRLSEDERKTSRTWELRTELLREQTFHDVGRLPPIGLLIVDEAHLLEQTFAQAFASGASMSRLMFDMRKLHEEKPRAVLAQDLKAMDAAWKTLREVGAVVGTDRENTSNNAALRESVEAVRAVLGKIMSRVPKVDSSLPEVRHLRAVYLTLEIAARATGERAGMTTRVSWSPSVQWPSIEVGRYDVSRELDFLWALVVRDRSVLVSGTLYEDVSLAGLENIRRVLSVRSNLVRPLPPVRPAWLFDPVTLHLVGNTAHADGLPRFRRPTQRDRLDAFDFAERSERWRSDISDYLTLTWESAAGGTLVLLTSHAERSEILSRLEGRIPSDCLLSQGSGLSLDTLRLAFLEITAAGRRPLLLGVGAAWTGLDISGDGLAAITGRAVPAKDDNVLTDLVIPIAPIGVNRSLTHEWRRERTGMIAEIGATSMTMRQGCGRLVRREGLPSNRRLHFLDARVHESAWNALLLPAVRALARYTRRLNV